LKSKTTKEKIQFTTVSLGLPEADETVVSEIKKKLELIKQREQDKRKRASAINNLESFIYDTKDKFQQDDFFRCSTQDERDNIVKSLEEASEWLFDADDSVETKVKIKDNFNAIKL
jgi:hypoxia up-regulated 1